MIVGGLKATVEASNEEVPADIAAIIATIERK
jgi:hypothetical protein